MEMTEQNQIQRYIASIQNSIDKMVKICEGLSEEVLRFNRQKKSGRLYKCCPT